jgi:hypothetical protein
MIGITIISYVHKTDSIYTSYKHCPVSCTKVTAHNITRFRKNCFRPDDGKK